MMKKVTRLWLTLLPALFFAACATLPMDEGSEIEIEYSLGHDRYRFSALEKGKQVQIKTYLGKDIVQEGKVDAVHYEAFLKRALTFIDTKHQEALLTSPCRNPYTIQVRLKKESHSCHGCRSSSNGSLSKLVKEGEMLLLYSKN